MATQQTVKPGTNRPQRSFRIRLHKLPLVTRRFAAAVIEVSLVAVSGLVPYSIGIYAQSHSTSEPVPLTNVLVATQEAIAKTLALPLRNANQQVPPLTNLFWCAALFAPLALTSWQFYKLGKNGQTSAKAMFGVRVVTASGEPPGIIRACLREVAGRWGLPVGVAYTIWRYSGAFPDGGILLGLLGLMLLFERATLLGDKQRRTLHDRLAGTFVVDAARKFASNGGGNSRFHKNGRSVRMEVLFGDRAPESEASANGHRQTFTTIVLTPDSSWRNFNVWQWMRQHPGLTMLILAFACMASVLGTFVGTQIYIQTQANRRVFNQQNNEVFLALVKQLSATSANALSERRGAMLALARLDDARAVPFLVDLLGQEKTEESIDAIAQALVSVGPEALPHLQRLNRSLQNDQQTPATKQERRSIALRQRASQRTIAKILNIYSSQTHNADLSRTDLGAVEGGQFTLVLDRADLSGINFKGAILNNASLRGSRFYGVGEDKRLDTFDDRIANLSGAELKQANLTDAILSYVSANRTNFTRAILNRANLVGANLSGANLSSTRLVAADLREAVLENASLTGAELTNANLTQSNLHGARLGRVSAVGTQFEFAELARSNWEGAELTNANFRHANLEDANLNWAKLVGVNLTRSQLKNANLQNANLGAADLRGANLDGANFKGVTFVAHKATKSDRFIETPPAAADAARVTDVDFTNVKNLDAKQITFICDKGGRHPQCR